MLATISLYLFERTKVDEKEARNDPLKIDNAINSQVQRYLMTRSSHNETRPIFVFLE